MFTIRCLALFALAILIAEAGGACQASATTQPAATQPAASQPADSLEAIGEGYMQLLQDVTATFKTVTDEASAKAAIPAIDRFGTRNHDLRARTEKAGIQIGELQKFMESKYPEQLKALQAPFVVEMERISNSHDKAMKKIIREACMRNGIGVASTIKREQE